MKKIITLLLILSTMIFIGCGNDVTNSTSGGGNGGGSGEAITAPDGLASTHDGTWYFYSEDGTVKDLVVTIANGGMTGLKTSSGIVLDFVKDNFNSKLASFDITMLGLKNYIVYKDGYTGNINFDGNIGYIKIKDSLNNIVIEGMLSRTQRSTVIDASFVGTYTATGRASRKIDVTSDLITFTRTVSSGKSETYKIPAVYFTKNGNIYTSEAINYPDTVLNFDTLKFTIKHINTSYYATDADFSKSGVSSSETPLSSEAYEYTKQQ